MRISLSLIVVATVVAIPAAASAAEPDRLREAAAVVSALRTAPDNQIPQELWTRAQCVVAIPSMKKAAFVVGGEYGRGVMSCRNASGWSAPLFMQLAKGRWGLQIGAEAVDLVLLVMNRNGIESLLDNKIALGADASVLDQSVVRDRLQPMRATSGVARRTEGNAVGRRLFGRRRDSAR